MHRFFADERGIQGGMAYLEAEDARHALRVLRLDVGAQVQLFADGQAYAASICQTGPDGVAVRVLEKLKSPEASLRVTLYQGVPKGDKMDYIVQKCTEAGVCRIVPVEMPRCVAHLDGKDDKKLARWNRIAREAAKQAFRPVTPEVAAPIDLNALCRALPGHQLALVPWEDAREGTLPRADQPGYRRPGHRDWPGGRHGRKRGAAHAGQRRARRDAGAAHFPHRNRRAGGNHRRHGAERKPGIISSLETVFYDRRPSGGFFHVRRTSRQKL